MAVQDPGLNIGYLLSNVDLSASQFCAVSVGTADMNIVLSTAGTVPSLGILQNKPLAAQAADVRVVGVSKVKAGAAYSRGTLLMSDGTGRMITATTTKYAVAYALEAATAANEIRSAYVTTVYMI